MEGFFYKEGNMLMHSGKKGMKWGYTDGQLNGLRTAQSGPTFVDSKDWKDNGFSGKKMADWSNSVNADQNRLTYHKKNINSGGDYAEAVSRRNAYWKGFDPSYETSTLKDQNRLTYHKKNINSAGDYMEAQSRRSSFFGDDPKAYERWRRLKNQADITTGDKGRGRRGTAGNVIYDITKGRVDVNKLRDRIKKLRNRKR